jgi:hypothetical protein
MSKSTIFTGSAGSLGRYLGFRKRRRLAGGATIADSRRTRAAARAKRVKLSPKSDRLSRAAA